ncbi:fumarylacetoacetate hydrolase family protein [Jannaschia ovalis]|uniref:Fumarylacetoacetate hydrolase family protein n=1 Tax=Jannaschia ovalis TaxID=3038773 RepID=A0ABY8LFZ6_9RHOB|nr:fumarylacetoacetate hydrolase family protein [Jannaschia sp. GRR-S6-38]WGH80215.1 fumarylacetoacetate hydrolase family protein [Jannaschia sp. GRR-S6-38]
MSYVIPPPEPPSLAVAGRAARFPIRRVFCVGRNYAAHAREMGKDPDREPPFFFMKPGDSVVPAAGVIPYPPETAELHHEVELVVALAAGGRDLSPAQEAGAIWGATVGIDLTRRDLQGAAKAAGRPWDWGKGFDASAPMAPLVPIAEVPALDRGGIWLEVNGTPRQRGDLSEMIWPVLEHVAIISRSMALAPGDLVMTGTPAGVGPLQPGDRVRAGIDGLAELSFEIGARG